MNNQEAIKILKRNKPTGDWRKCGVELCEAVDVAIAALEKQIPKKVDVWANGKEYCPRCEQDMSCLGFKVCISCGQALDW